MSDKLFFIIRKITVAPIMAAVMLIVVQVCRPEVFGSTAAFICSILFLTILPLMGYPLQKYIPKYKDAGRKGQRELAMIFAVLGYILGCVSILFLKQDNALWVVYLEYLLSGLAILVFNKVFHVKMSGHACGVIGPVALLLYFKLYGAAVVGAAAACLVYLASLKTKRHTGWQLVGGSVIPLVVMGMLTLFF